MIVYVLTAIYYVTREEATLGVYSTKEAAEAAWEQWYEENLDCYQWITEIILDEPASFQ